MRKSGAFTLIELLVVVAIIGLLSSVVLVALRNARDKAKDGVIMKQLSEVRTVAQYILVESGAYNISGNLLCKDNTLDDANTRHPELKAIEDKVKQSNNNQNVICYAQTSSYCVRSPLNLGGAFCVDSEGRASTTVTTCNGTAPVVCK